MQFNCFFKINPVINVGIINKNNLMFVFKLIIGLKIRLHINDLENKAKANELPKCNDAEVEHDKLNICFAYVRCIDELIGKASVIPCINISSIFKLYSYDFFYLTSLIANILNVLYTFTM